MAEEKYEDQYQHIETILNYASHAADQLGIDFDTFKVPPQYNDRGAVLAKNYLEAFNSLQEDDRAAIVFKIIETIIKDLNEFKEIFAKDKYLFDMNELDDMTFGN